MTNDFRSRGICWRGAPLPVILCVSEGPLAAATFRNAAGRPFEKEETMPVRTILTLQPKAGQRQALIDAFKRLDVFGHAMQVKGCLSVEMLESDDEAGPLFVTALWTDRDSVNAWQSNRWRAEETGELDDYLEPGSERAVYDVILSTD
jgi:heme-degrading monooxygenase HmoA